MTEPPPPPTPPPYGAPPPSSSGPDVGAALSYGWKKFQENVGPLIAIVAVPAAINIVLSIIGSVSRSILVIILCQILAFFVGTAATLGIVRASLMLTAGEPIDFGKAFQYDRWGEWFVFSIVYGLILTVGLIALCIGILFALAFFGLAPFYFVDGRMTIGDALRASYQAATQKGLAFPVLLSIIVGILGVIACGVGILVTEPVAYVAVAFLYRYSVGQPVAA